MWVSTETALGLVKSRLNRMAADTSLDDYFRQRIAAAVAELEAAKRTSARFRLRNCIA